jgi:hypothetical protein
MRNASARARQAAAPARGRRTGNMDAGTVALAMSAMSLYWTMPLMLSRAPRRRRRRPQPPQENND